MFLSRNDPDVVRSVGERLALLGGTSAMSTGEYYGRVIITRPSASFQRRNSRLAGVFFDSTYLNTGEEYGVGRIKS